MKKLSVFIKIVSVGLAVLFFCISVAIIDFKSVFEKFACVSVMAAMPIGIGDFLNINKENIDNAEEIYKVPSVNKPLLDNTTENKPVSAVVDEVCIGNIIKKTITPYNANLSHKNIYINNQSGATVNIAESLVETLDFEVVKDNQPQILIYHTHTTESYMKDESDYYTDSDEPRSTESEKNVIAVGDIIATKLRNAGYAVIHDTSLNDYPGYSGSYFRSRESVQNILQQYPSIKITIDVHRDSISSGKTDKVAPVVSINGKEAAQVMLVMGSETDGVSDYPDWRKNLNLAIKLQSELENSYPTLARSLLLRSAKYNQDLTTGSILIEVGSDANTFEQAFYSASLVGNTMVRLLDSLK